MPEPNQASEQLTELVRTRLSKADRERLDALALELDRPPSYLLRLALTRLLAEHDGSGANPDREVTP